MRYHNRLANYAKGKIAIDIISLERAGAKKKTQPNEKQKLNQETETEEKAI